VPTEPEATTSDPSRLQVSFRLKFQLIRGFIIFIGGRLVLHLIKKHTNCTHMQGVKVGRPHDFKRMNSSKRSVSRAYGGIFTATEVRERIMRAFLIEEFKRFKNINAGKVADDKKKKNKKAKKDAAKK
tara:strand:+ start:170 stop:553 length:384 start_codon:yes stop_codon:yes gene_type:complete